MFEDLDREIPADKPDVEEEIINVGKRHGLTVAI